MRSSVDFLMFSMLVSLDCVKSLIDRVTSSNRWDCASPSHQQSSQAYQLQLFELYRVHQQSSQAYQRSFGAVCDCPVYPFQFTVIAL